MEDSAPEELAVSLAHMMRHLLAQDSVESTLDRITTHAMGKVEGCQEASILMVGPGRRLENLTSTSWLGQESDRLQTELGEGPCFDAIDQRREVYGVADMSVGDDLWPRYAPKARELGIGSSMGFLLYTTRETLGALNLYSSQPHAFTERSKRLGWVFASHAAVAFASARNDAQLHEAIKNRQKIGEAVGITMERYRLSEDQAFEVLKKISQDHNVKLRDIARQVVETGEISGFGDR